MHDDSKLWNEKGTNSKVGANLDNEQRIWSIITVVCFVALVVLVASEYGFSLDLNKESNTGANDDTQGTELTAQQIIQTQLLWSV